MKSTHRKPFAITNRLFLSTVGFLSMFLIGAGLLAGLWALRQNQDLRQRADVIPAVILNFKPHSNPTAARVGTDITINTKLYRLVGAGIQGTITNTTTDKVKITPQAVMNLQPIVNVLEQDGANVNFYLYLFASIDESKPATTRDAEVSIASIEITQPNSAGVQVSLDGNTATPVFGQDFAPVVLPNTLTLVGAPVASPTPTPTATPATTPAPPDGGIHRSCNEYCADDRECDSKYECFYNRCRNPLNVENDKCELPPTPTPQPSPTPTATPNVGGVVRTSPTPRASASPSPSAIVIKKVVINSPSPSVSPRPSASATASARPTASPVASVRPTPASNRPVKTTEPAEKTGSALTTIIVGVVVLVLLLGLGYAFYRFLMGSGVQF